MVKELFSRNWLFISKSLQEKIGKVKILAAGTGLGSQICILAARVGFSNFILADGDVVSVSNLNRQGFDIEDLNKNKAKCLREKILKINPEAKIKVIDKYLTRKDLIKIIPQVDLVINTIDFDSDAFVACSEISKKYKKVEFFPLNLGFSGTLIVLKSKDFITFFKEKNREIVKRKILTHIISSHKTSSFLKNKFIEYSKSNMKYEPQTGVAANITAAITIWVMIKVVNNEKVREFPDFYHLDIDV